MIKIVTGQKLIDIAESVIKEIEKYKDDLSTQNIIVVPDRFSLLAEKMVFRVLGIKSSFNIKVMSITNLARKIISDAGLDCVYLSSDECKFLLYRALQKCRNDFQCFSKNLSQGLCQKIQNILSLIRASEVSSNMLSTAGQHMSQGLSKKLYDLSMINNEYENLLCGRLDGTNTLKLFTKIIEQTKSIKTSNFYFVGFDAFTKQGYEILRNVFKTAKNVCIGCFLPNNNKNNLIFDKEMYNNITEILAREKLEYISQTSYQLLNIPQKAIFENVYAYNIQRCDNYNYAQVLELATRQDEIQTCANKIQNLVKLEKCKFSDITVITTSDYFSDIANTFDKYQISHYIDQSKQFYDTEICNYIRFILDLKNDNLSQESLLNLLTNTFVDIESKEKWNAINYIIENDIEYKKTKQLFEDFELGEFKQIIQDVQTFEASDQIENYIKILQNILKNQKISEKIDNLYVYFAKNNDLFNQKLYAQVLDKIEKLNQDLTNSIKEKLTFSEFYDLYISALKDIKISQVPLGADSVFVGDASSSFFEKTKYYFILGSNQDVLPTPTKDLALISDSEIESLKNIIQITPTSRMINRRTKFKLFDLLSSATERFFVFYHLQDESGKKVLPSPFVNDIVSLFGKEILLSQSDIYDKFVDDNITKTMFLCPNITQAINNQNSENVDGALIKNSLLSLGINLGKQVYDKVRVDNGHYLLKGDETKISQIESYFNCPFAHFVKYGLKLKEQKTANIEAFEFGNFLHKFADVYIKQNKDILAKLSSAEIDEKVEKILSNIFEQKDYKKFSFEENLVTKNMLKEETKRFANFLTFEAQNSDFVPSETEYYFASDNVFITYKDKKYKIVGVVDRIDKCDNYFRIIDYKTGSGSAGNSSLKNVYYGTKIQVYIYLYAIEKIKNIKPFGAFYLPLVQSYSDAGEINEEDYKLHGYFLGEPSLVEKADKTFNVDNKTSRFLQAKYSAQSTRDNKKFVNSCDLTKQELENITNYALKLTRNALSEIIDGNIKVSPFDSACTFCKYKSICGIDTQNMNIRKGDKVDKNTFSIMEEKDGEWI